MEQPIAASNVYTVKNLCPDRVAGFTIHDTDGFLRFRRARYLRWTTWHSRLSFYDWYSRPAASLLPANPSEQTDVPESADWHNSSYIVARLNVPQTRTPDAHFFTEVRRRGTKPSR
ncbi:molybdopterin-dependent oxidoreductase [Salmonella enterica subsp. enterica]|nr:molybdopterin-dependent oxidoreductase [Salmonella enterica subsp. enterica]